MNKGYPLNLRRYRLVRKKDNKYHPAYSHNHVEKEAQLFAGRSKVLSRIAATSIHTENHITNVTNKESKLCNIHGTILLYFTSRIRKFPKSKISSISRLAATLAEQSGNPIFGGEYGQEIKANRSQSKHLFSAV